MDTYIEFGRNGEILLQDPENKRHKFLSPPINARVGMKWHGIHDFMDYLEERYQRVQWITNDEGLAIDLTH